MLLPGEMKNKNRFLIFVFMKNKIANRPKLPVMEGEGKTGSGATAKKMAVVLKSGCLEVKECSQPRPQGLPAFQNGPWGRGWECSLTAI